MSERENSYCKDFRRDSLIESHLLVEEFNRPFLLPVDVDSLGLTDYYTIVKTPMDLSTVKKRLDYRWLSGI